MVGAIMVKQGRKDTYRSGLIAEIIAALYLFFKGYRLLAWRYKCPGGEIDLVAQRAGVVVFIEVKERPTTDDGLFAITPQMRGRITTAARSYIAHHRKIADTPMRFDVIAISLPFSIRHLDNAWQAVS